MAGNPLYYRFDHSGEGISLAHPLPVVSAPFDPVNNPNPNGNPATIFAGQMTATSSAASLPSRVLVNGILIKNTEATNIAYVGPVGVTTATGFQISPGATVSFGVQNANAVYVITAAAQTAVVAYSGS